MALHVITRQTIIIIIIIIIIIKEDAGEDKCRTQNKFGEKVKPTSGEGNNVKYLWNN